MLSSLCPSGMYANMCILSKKRLLALAVCSFILSLVLIKGGCVHVYCMCLWANVHVLYLNSFLPS